MEEDVEKLKTTLVHSLILKYKQRDSPLHDVLTKRLRNKYADLFALSLAEKLTYPDKYITMNLPNLTKALLRTLRDGSSTSKAPSDGRTRQQQEQDALERAGRQQRQEARERGREEQRRQQTGSSETGTKKRTEAKHTDFE